MTFERSTDGEVVILQWNDGENRYHPDSLADWHAHLDDIEGTDGPLALVVTGTGKFFSNGLDLDWMMANADESGAMLGKVHRLLGRMMTLNCYTVGALNGHVFAGGAMLSCGFDYRIMREDRGYWCLPEVDLGIPLTDEMYAVVSARMPHAALHDSLTTGRRYGAPEALRLGIIEQTAPDAEVLPRSIEVAQSMAHKDRRVIARHKQQMYSWVTDLTNPA